MSHGVIPDMLPPVRLMHLDPFDGLQEQTLVLATGLRAAGLDVQIYCCREAPLFKQAVEAGVRVRALPSAGKIFGLRQLWSLWRALRSDARQGKRRAILHACDEAALLLACRYRRMPGGAHPVCGTRATTAVPGQRALQACRAAAICICTSRAGMAALVEQGIDASCVLAVPAGLHPGGCRPRPSRTDERVVFCVPGMLIADNGFEFVIDALAILARETGLPPWEVHVPGMGPQLAALVDRAKQAGVDRYMAFFGGFEENRIMRHSDVCVVPETRAQGDGFSILRGWAAGMPVLAAGDTANREYVVHGRNGMCFARGNAESLADCMAQYMRDPSLAESFAGAGARSLKQYPVGQLVRLHCDAYARCVEISAIRAAEKRGKRFLGFDL